MAALAAWASALSLALAAGTAFADVAEPMLRPGAYDIEVRVELPHVAHRLGVETRRVCLPAAGPGALPVPVLSANSPLAGCAPENVELSGGWLRYAIVCAGRDAAQGHASYRLRPDAFTGEVAVVLGAKNMTMAERQVGRRVGDCDPAASVAGN